MMKQLLLFLFLSINFNLFAQPSPPELIIKGVVVDSASRKPLGLATLILRDVQSTVAIKSMLTRDDGTFEFTVSTQKKYNLDLAYVGYRSKSLEIAVDSLAGKRIANVGEIPMVPASRELKEVAITATRPILTKEIDRISFDVQADPESKSNDALEMLRKVPMITVDGNDVIQLKGSTNYVIFINGKPSALMVNNPADVLKAMPAAVIKKIEVITIPPSKYDGEGLAGIINIITLQKNEEGFNGSIFTRYNNIFGERGSLSLSAKKGKFGVNTFLGLGHQPSKANVAGSMLTTFSPATNLSQQGENVNGGNFNNGQAVLSFEADSLDLFTASMDFVNRKFEQNTFRNSQLYILPDSLAQSNQLNNAGINTIGALDLGLNYQLSFRQNKNELLTFSYQYSSANIQQTNYVTETEIYNYAGSGFNQENSTGSKEQTFQIDFVKPVNKSVTEAGVKAILRTNTSDFADENLDALSGQYLPDTALTNQFNYHQDVYSIYGTYQLTLAGWTVKAGARAENTFISGDFSSETAFAGQHYINLLPAISLQRNYAQTGIFSLGYTERIQRPGIMQLNPFVNRSNPEFIITGDPDLRPVLNHIFELSYSKFAKAGVNASLSYTFADNTIQSVTSLLSNTVSKTTYSNIGKNQSAGISLSTNYPITENIIFNINAQLAHLWITGIYNSQFYKNDGDQGNVSAFARYNFDKNFNATVNFGYSSGNVYLQGSSSDYVYTSLNIIKELFDKRFTVSLTVYDPFQPYNTGSSYTRTPDFLQSSYSQYYYQNIRLALNYKFGKLSSTIKTNNRGIRNDDVKGNNNGSEN